LDRATEDANKLFAAGAESMLLRGMMIIGAKLFVDLRGVAFA
jgi:hypothetical protein